MKISKFDLKICGTLYPYLVIERPFMARRCQSNQSNAESIERNWTQSNDCDSIAERNRNSIEYYSGFAVRLSNVIESIEYYGKFQFDWFDYVRLTQRSFNQSDQLNADNQSNAIERKIPIERNRILPWNRPFDCDSIAFNNRIAIIQLRSIAFDWFNCDFRSIAFDWHRLAILKTFSYFSVNSYQIDLKWALK